MNTTGLPRGGRHSGREAIIIIIIIRDLELNAHMILRAHDASERLRLQEGRKARHPSAGQLGERWSGEGGRMQRSIHCQRPQPASRYLRIEKEEGYDLIAVYLFFYLYAC